MDADQKSRVLPEPDFKQPQPPQTNAVQPPASSTGPSKRRSYIIITLIFATLGFLLQNPYTGTRLWDAAREDALSKQHYALCSREGAIYTVDAERPKAECLVVKGRRVERVGSLGAPSFTVCYSRGLMFLSLRGGASLERISELPLADILHEPRLHRCPWTHG